MKTEELKAEFGAVTPVTVEAWNHRLDRREPLRGRDPGRNREAHAGDRARPVTSRPFPCQPWLDLIAFSAEPALNHSTCASESVWLTVASSSEPSGCFIATVKEANG